MIDNAEWLRQRRLRDLRNVAPDKIIELINDFHKDLKQLNNQLNKGAITPLEWIKAKSPLFSAYMSRLRQLDTVRCIDSKTFCRTVSIFCEEEVPITNFDYKLYAQYPRRSISGIQEISQY